ncbi:MAG: glycerol-3-phosphate dehydrogenase C-terminal domain-containing protein, partial [Acidimicrobiales bacterium]
ALALRLEQTLGRRLKGSPTRHLRLRGALALDERERLRKSLESGGLVDKEAITHLLSRYGTETRAVVGLVSEHPELELARRFDETLPYLRAEALYAVRYEMATGLDDILSRRTRSLLLDTATTIRVAAEVAALVGPELGWDADAEAEHSRAFAARAEMHRVAAVL